MKALIYEKYGSSDVLEIKEIEKPTPRQSEVLVKVHAVSINSWDWELLQDQLSSRLTAGLFKPNKIIGSDIAGRVEGVGTDVTRFTSGDAVFGDLSRFSRHGGFGGFAQYVCAAENALTLKPEGMTFEQAASIPQAGMLALQALLVRGPPKSGQKVLINGAGGGVGTFAIQLAKLHDVEVTGVDGAAKLPLLRALGCDHVIDYRKEDFTQNGKHYDLILDSTTNRSPFAYARALVPGGTYATVGGASHLLQVVLLRPWIRLSSNKYIRLVLLKQNRDLPYLIELFNAGKLTPVIDGPYRFSDVRDAFRRFGAAEHQGKIVVTMDL